MTCIRQTLCLFGSFAIAMLAASAAQAACDWDINGTYNFYQNNGITVTFIITQTGGHLSGNGKYRRGDNLSAVNDSGPIDGTINGNQFSFSVRWFFAGGSVYEGVIGASGSLSGNTHDSNGNGVTGWHEYYGKKAACITAAQPPAPPAQTAFCQSYATQTVAQVTEAQKLRCNDGDPDHGYSGARWDDRLQGHLDWCNSLGGNQTLPSSEIAARTQGLQACQARIDAAAARFDATARARLKASLAKQFRQGNATVILPVDVYAAAGGAGNPIASLAVGAKVVVAGCPADDWCHITQGVPAVPGGAGWVYDGADYRSLKF